jgi:hypothetical protein
MLLSSDHIHWIDETLIRALQLAPPSLSISIRIHVTGTPATTDDDSYVLDGAAEPNRSEDSLLAMESVKLQNGRADLQAILRDEAEMAIGRMSVSGQSSSLHLHIKVMLNLYLVCGSQTIVRSVRSALQFPMCSPLSIANGGPSVTLHIESFGYA